METVLLLLIGVCCLAIIYGVARLVRVYRESKQREMQRREEVRARLDQIQKEHRERVRKVNSQPISKPAHAAFVGNTDKLVTDKPKVESKPSYAPSPTQSVRNSDDNFLDGVVTGYMVNSLINSFGSKSEPTERSVGVSKSESSWGFDDSDSRKSISDSMDTSSSWSSSSSDSFSSSDSGPSSDW